MCIRDRNPSFPNSITGYVTYQSSGKRKKSGLAPNRTPGKQGTYHSGENGSDMERQNPARPENESKDIWIRPVSYTHLVISFDLPVGTTLNDFVEGNQQFVIRKMSSVAGGAQGDPITPDQIVFSTCLLYTSGSAGPVWNFPGCEKR